MHLLTIEQLDSHINRFEAMLHPSQKASLRHLAEECLPSLRKKKALLARHLEKANAYGQGYTLKHESRDAWAMYLHDATEPGKHRWQEFQADGFLGHATEDTLDACIGRMVDNDYVVEDPLALVRVAGTLVWSRGCEILSLIAKCNAGDLSWTEANRRREEIYAAYAARGLSA